MISPAVEICRDGGQRLHEYRGFVVDGVLDGMCMKSETPADIPNDVLDRTFEVMKELGSTEFPQSYVMDVIKHFHEGDIVADICEFNPIALSGRGPSNSLFVHEI